MQIELFGEQLRNKYFESLPLGKIYYKIPIEQLSTLLQCPKKKDHRSIFTNKGKIALQFLKTLTGHSDKILVDRINTDVSYRLFCGLSPNLGKQVIKDYNIIYKIRKEVSEHYTLDAFQNKCIEKWLPQMEETTIGLSDATVYESYIKYPIDTNLLWDCCEKLNSIIRSLKLMFGLNLPRNKYSNVSKAYHSYCKKRKPRIKESRSIKMRLLNLLKKMLGQLKERYEKLEDIYTKYIVTQTVDYEQYKTIKKIYCQQKLKMVDYDLFKQKVGGGAIVSLYKPYIHPIVRGKQKKPVEFGIKINMWQVDGLNFIEHQSFRAFHEGIRLKNGIAFHKKTFGELKAIGADCLYATNANRKMNKYLEIADNFAPKGRRKNDPIIRKQEDDLRRELNKQRNTVLEGSFGNEKNHYGLRKVNMRSEPTEIMYIFFGIMTANSVKLAKRKDKDERVNKTA